MTEARSTETEVAIADMDHCQKCGNRLSWRDCWNCGGEGFSDHDCGEDCCCCLNPEDNVECDICDGDGGWKQCRLCYTGDDWDD